MTAAIVIHHDADLDDLRAQLEHAQATIADQAAQLQALRNLVETGAARTEHVLDALQNVMAHWFSEMVRSFSTPPQQAAICEAYQVLVEMGRVRG